MLDLNLATTQELRIERDNCSASISIIHQQLINKEISLEKSVEDAVWFIERYAACLERLLKDFDVADKLAGDLVSFGGGRNEH